MAQAAFPFDSTLPGTLLRRRRVAPTGVAHSIVGSPAPQPGQPGQSGQSGQSGPSSQEAGLDSAGFEIGWDHAHYRLTPPLPHLHADNPVRQGWQAGRAAFGSRTLRAGTTQRQWLALRLAAWQAGQVFEDVQVTPHLLGQIAVAECPVSRLPLVAQATATHPSADDAVVQRLNLDAAYAAGNLAVLHRQVADARGGQSVDQLWALAERIASGESAAVRGLDAHAWRRLAVLASFATPLPHARAAMLPLLVLPPNRLRVINPVQALQVMLSLQFSAGGYARRLLGLAALMPNGDVRQAFQIFMHTLLARRLAAGPNAEPAALRRALEDSWADVLVQRRWQRLALRLSAADCEQLLQRAAQRGLVVGSGRWISSDAATEGWALPASRPSRAGLPAAQRLSAVADSGCSAAASAAVGTATAVGARPGSARSLGSQKLAS